MLALVSRWMLVRHSQLVVSGWPVPTYLACRRSSSCCVRSLSAYDGGERRLVCLRFPRGKEGKPGSQSIRIVGGKKGRGEKKAGGRGRDIPLW